MVSQLSGCLGNLVLVAETEGFSYFVMILYSEPQTTSFSIIMWPPQLLAWKVILRGSRGIQIPLASYRSDSDTNFATCLKTEKQASTVSETCVIIVTSESRWKSRLRPDNTGGTDVLASCIGYDCTIWDFAINEWNRMLRYFLIFAFFRRFLLSRALQTGFFYWTVVSLFLTSFVLINKRRSG